ncbi:Uncharacterised protein [Pseudomonas luteola]|uniref:Uncharacterized protein n=1 Tax=Pseudomonas luteola TaxID=47886 RepID=A0A2X2D9N4_PSELU|nr:Uncharacterised protein [Pseudomonas luteola]
MNNPADEHASKFGSIHKISLVPFTRRKQYIQIEIRPCRIA